MPLLPRPAPGARLSPTGPLALLLVAIATACACTADEPAFPRDAAPSESSRSDPWTDALRFEFNAASEEFARRHAAAPDDPRLALAHASALLARQPRTQANILAARAVFEPLAANQPPGSTFALAARLLLARTAESHLVPPRPDEARERYEALLREHAGHPLADQAAMHLALLAAYPLPGAPALPPDQLHARLDELRAAVRTPGVIRELHALQGRLRLDNGEPRAALPHLLAARAIGYRQPDRNSDASLAIANLARETGDGSLALEHYHSFLRERPRDVRASTVRRYVAELEAATSPVPLASPRP